jgi:very-short-patch-repair endonuclease
MPHRSAFDQKALRALLVNQHGVLARAQALGVGMSLGVLRHRLREGGPWQVLLPGVYLASTGMATVGQREVSALLYAGPGSLMTGPAALYRHGIRAPISENVDVLVPAERKRRDSGFVRLHRTTRMPAGVCTSGVVRYAPPARAVADAARLLSDIQDVRAVVADAVQQRRCSPETVVAELKQGPLRNSAQLRQVLGEIAEGIRSVAEAELRILLKRSQLPEPIFNARLFAGKTFIAAPDCWWQDAGVAVEVDSREWHLSPRDWERTMSRRARMSALGIIVLHFTPRQIRTQPMLVAERIRSALEAAANRPALRIMALPAM